MPPWPPKRAVRSGAGVIVLVCLLLLLGSFLTASTASTTPPGSIESATEPSSITVISTQGFYVGDRPGSRDVAELIAVRADGTVLYHNTTHQVYYDVDPVPGTRATVEYVAADRVGGDRCPGSTQCSRNVVEQVNLTTGRVTTVYTAITPKFDGGRWHDVDRINATHLLVADIVYNRVMIVATDTDEIVWQWNASEHYPLSAGGGQQDWTHMNDVELLADGRIMVSVRNMDEVIFIESGGEVDAGWTLGNDDDHGTLYEQHNPDYIPSNRGGPAVVLADSENNRVIEYHRRGGEWQAVWSWRDTALQWPRDADRLPTGHTLVVDSHGDRVLEVGLNGSIVWHYSIGRPYDAERLDTGDESSGGFAAGTSPTCPAPSPCDAPPRAAQRPTDQAASVIWLKDRLSGVIANSLLFVAPPWIQFTDLVVIGFLGVTLLLWAGLEWRWSTFSVRIRRDRD